MIYTYIYVCVCVCVCVYTPNNKASKHKWQNLRELQREIDESMTIVGNITLHKKCADSLENQ